MKALRFLTKHTDLFSTIIVLFVAIGLTLIGFGNDLARWLITIFAAYIAIKLLIGMIDDLRHGKWGIDILAVTAILATLAVGEYWATIMIVLMMASGEALEDYANERAKSELTALIDRVPTIAHLVKGQATEDIRVSDVRVDDLLLIKTSEVIPVDGIVLDGSSSIDESSLTGESEPVEVTKGSEVMSGTVNGGAPLTIRATKAASDSQYAQIVKLVKSAADSRAPFVRMADRFAVPFTLVSYAIAGVAWATSGEASRFAEVLVVATPCPLLIAAPVALISGMSRAAKHGIIIKSGAFIEKLANVRTAAFDKTGTLTEGSLKIASIVPLRNFSEDQLLQYAASVEQLSTHVLAESIVQAAKDRRLELLTIFKGKELSGNGVMGKYEGNTIIAGKRDLLESEGITLGDFHVPHTATFVAYDGQCIGYITFADVVRENSRSTIEALRKLGVRSFVMLTGDNKTTAERIASELGVTDVRAECLPKDKYEIVHTLKDRPVMMTGDGINDAPVLAAADVGVAMGARGATAASESADVVVMLDDISKVAQVVSVAKRTIRIALQSVWIGIALSIVLMIIAAFGVIPAVVGAGLQEVVDVIVILNALRAHRDGKSLV